jgi:hypothetical protein
MTSAWWAKSHPIRHGEAWVRKHGEEVAVFNPDTETLTLMNPSAFAIWELCDGATTPAEMADAVAELASVAGEQARADVEKALDELGELGLVEIPDAPGEDADAG